MKSFKLIFNYVASLCLVFVSSFAQASGTTVKLSQINEQASVVNFESELKKVFKTKEDHRLISYDFVKLKKLAPRWLWRFEKTPEGLAFRVNGKVQFRLAPVEGKPNTFNINGKEVELPNGISYQAFSKKAMAAVNGKQANFDFLFFEEAHAGFFTALLIGGIIIGGAALLGRGASASTGRRCRPQGARGTSGFSSRNVKVAASHYARSCNGNRVSVNGSYYKCNNWNTVEDCVAYKVRNGAFGKNYRSCKQSGATTTQSYDPIGSVVGQTCSKSSRNAQANSCNNCRGNQACCAAVGIRCQQPQVVAQQPTSGYRTDGRCGHVWSLCQNAWNATQHCGAQPAPAPAAPAPVAAPPSYNDPIGEVVPYTTPKRRGGSDVDTTY